MLLTGTVDERNGDAFCSMYRVSGRRGAGVGPRLRTDHGTVGRPGPRPQDRPDPALRPSGQRNTAVCRTARPCVHRLAGRSGPADGGAPARVARTAGHAGAANLFPGHGAGRTGRLRAGGQSAGQGHHRRPAVRLLHDRPGRTPHFLEPPARRHSRNVRRRDACGRGPVLFRRKRAPGHRRKGGGCLHAGAIVDRSRPRQQKRKAHRVPVPLRPDRRRGTALHFRYGARHI